MSWSVLVASALGTEYVHGVGEKAATDERRTTLIAYEALVVPVTILERDVFRAANTLICDLFWHFGIHSDWFVTREAFLGEQLAETIGTIRMVFARRKTLTG